MMCHLFILFFLLVDMENNSTTDLSNGEFRALLQRVLRECISDPSLSLDPSNRSSLDLNNIKHGEYTHIYIYNIYRSYTHFITDFPGELDQVR